MRIWGKLLLPLLLLLLSGIWMQRDMREQPRQDADFAWPPLLSPSSLSEGLDAWFAPITKAPRRLREQVTGQYVDLHSVSFSPDGKRALAVGERGAILLSRDGGRSWDAETSLGALGPSMLGVSFSPDGMTALAVGSYGAILLSADGGSNWARQNSGSTDTLRSVSFSPDGKSAIAVGSVTILLSGDAGRTWATRHAAAAPPQGLRSGRLSPDGKNALAVGDGGVILLSEDGGQNWARQNSFSDQNLHSVGFSHDGKSAMVVGEGGAILVSGDGGKSWAAQTGFVNEFMWGLSFSFEGDSVLAVGYGGVILLSEDNGKTWVRRAGGDGDFLSSVSFSPDAKSALAVGGRGVIMLSEDGGKTWARRVSGNTQQVESLSFSPDGRSALAVGEGGAILLSGDGGKTWAAQPSRSRQWLRSVTFGPDGRSALVVGEGGTILLSGDGGKSWVAQTSGSQESLKSVSFSPDGKSVIAVGGGTILLSGDGGRSWGAQTSGSQESLIGVSFSPDGKSVIAVGRGTILLSGDGGRSWANQNSLSNEDLFSVSFGPDGKSALAVGYRGLILLSGDGGNSWTSQASGSTQLLRSVSFSPDGKSALAAGSGGAILLSGDGGKSWASQTSDGGGEVLWSVSFSPDGKTALAVGEDGVILLSGDGGKSWATRDSGSRVRLFSASLSPDGESAVAVGDEGVILLSGDGGKSWARQSSVSNQDLDSVSFSPDGKSALAAGSGGAILLSGDGGKSWVSQVSGSRELLHSVSLGPDTKSALAVGDEGVILLSRDGGKSWSVKTSGSGQPLRSVSFSPDGKSALAVGQGGAILLSSDGGLSWVAQSGGGDKYLLSVRFSPDGRTALASGGGGAVLLSRDGGKSWTEQTIGRTQILSSLSFSPDGKSALSVGNDLQVGRATGPDFKDWRFERALPSPPVVDPRPGRDAWQLPSPAALLMALLSLAWLAVRLSALGGRPELLRHDDTGGVHDNPVDRLSDDRLGTGVLARSMVRLLLSRDTEPPLALAICAPWGSGKSSVLRMLQRELARQGAVPIWFNAWHYRDDTQLLAALIEHVRDQMPTGLLSWRALRARLWLLHERVVRRRLPVLLLLAAAVLGLLQWQPAAWQEAGVSVCQWQQADQAVFGSAKANNSGPCEQPTGWLKSASSSLASAGVASASVVGVGLLVWLLGLWSKGPFTSVLLKQAAVVGQQLASASSLRAATSEAGFRYRFQREFGEVCKALGKGRLVLIIDDLDRCEPNQVEKVIATLNFLFNASADCHAVLGMDWNYVRTAMGLAYKDLSAELQAVAGADAAVAPPHTAQERAQFGENFLRKIVQLRIDVAVADGASVALHASGAGARAWGPLLPKLPAALWMRRVAHGLKAAMQAWRAFTWGRSQGKARSQGLMEWVAQAVQDALDQAAERRLGAALAWCALSVALFMGVQQVGARLAQPLSNPDGDSTKPVASQPLPSAQNEAASALAQRPTEATVTVQILWEPEANLFPTGLGWVLPVTGLVGLLLWLAWAQSQVQDSAAFREALQQWRGPLREVVSTPREWRRFQNRCRFAAMHLRVLYGERDRWLDRRRWIRAKRWAWAAGAPPPEQDVSLAEGDLVRLIAQATQHGKVADTDAPPPAAAFGESPEAKHSEASSRAFVRLLLHGDEAALDLSAWQDGALPIDALGWREALLALTLRTKPLPEALRLEVAQHLQARLDAAVQAAVHEAARLSFSENGYSVRKAGVA